MVRCSNCGADAPEMSTIDTTWARYGWRVTRKVADDGEAIVDFFCPDCWRAKRKAQASTRA